MDGSGIFDGIGEAELEAGEAAKRFPHAHPQQVLLDERIALAGEFDCR